MKKLLAVLTVAACVVSGAFALKNEVDVNFATQMATASSTSTNDLISTKIVTKVFDTAMGVDITDTAWLDKNLGVRVDLGLYFPSTTKTTVNTYVNGNLNDTLSGSSTYNYSDSSNTYVTFNVFAGFAYKAYVSQFVSLSVVPGLNFDIASVKYDDSTSTSFRLGAGADIVAKAFVTDKIYATVSCPLVYEFLESVDGTTTDNYKGRFMFTPKVGAGIRL